MPTSTIVVASQKGGSGKTSITLNLAVLAAREAPTLVLDCDPQGSLTYWHDRRDAPQPDAAPASLSNIEQSLRDAQAHPYRFVFVDTPPHNQIGIAAVMQPADCVVVPVRPTALDLHAAEATLKLAAALAKRTLVVLTQCQPPRLFTEAPSVREARAIFATLGCRVADQAIVHRGSVEQSVALGKSVGELEPSGPAEQEFKQVWMQLKRELAR